MQFPWHAWRRRKRRKYEGKNPFASKRALGQYLGQLSIALFNGEVSESEARACERIVVDFFKLQTLADFSYQLEDAITPQPDRKLPYAT